MSTYGGMRLIIDRDTSIEYVGQDTFEVTYKNKHEYVSDVMLSTLLRRMVFRESKEEILGGTNG